MNADQFILIGFGILIIILGLSGIASKSRRGTLWLKLFGETGAKIFYVLVGIAMMVFAFFI